MTFFGLTIILFRVVLRPRVGHCHLKIIDCIEMHSVSLSADKNIVTSPTYQIWFDRWSKSTLTDIIFVCFQEWELLVLCKLKWDMVTVTAQDFLELLVMRLHLGDLVQRDTVIRHAQTFIALATKGTFTQPQSSVQPDRPPQRDHDLTNTTRVLYYT